jgi:hypothetical protein
MEWRRRKSISLQDASMNKLFPFWQFETASIKLEIFQAQNSNN